MKSKLILFSSILLALSLPIVFTPHLHAETKKQSNASEDEKKDESLLNKLFAPGPLMEGHKAYEEQDCLKCHDAGRGIPESKCLDCHKEIRPFVEKKTGFHGLTKKACIECHSDHKGRLNDTTKIDVKTFKHDATGYKLVGKHADLQCTECHKNKRVKMAVRPNDTHYLGSTSSCVSCHKKDDVHFFSKGKAKALWDKKDCGECHGVVTWKKDIKFDHERDAKYKLVDRHAELTCAECHVPKNNIELAKYHWPNLAKSKCLACHEDTHKNNLSAKFRGGDCTKCHDQKKWEIKSFNHKVTGYPLRGKHGELRCTECHVQTANVIATKKTELYRWVALKPNCLSCHDDFHAFAKYKSKNHKNLGQCLTCHNEADWKQIHDFDHNKNTRYPIDGKHLDLKCAECHRPTSETTVNAKKVVTSRIYHWENLASKTCENCHESPHTKQFSPSFLKKKCTECHVTSDWHDSPGKLKSQFNHDQTRFKLTGSHTTLTCKECHSVNDKQVFKFASFEKQFCIDCHSSPHVNQFHPEFSAQACSSCHTTKDFKGLLPFDHDTTAFKLMGEHKKLKCTDCHQADPRIKPPPAAVTKKNKTTVWHKFVFPDLKAKSCNSCHTDYHAGQLDLQCSKCHNEEGWKKVKFDHNRDSQFRLNGKHSDLKCSECHKPTRQLVEFSDKKYQVTLYKPMPILCVSCHRADDVHKGSFGNQCSSCHSEKDWKQTKDFHKNFTLYGVHYTVSCNECHVNDRRLGGTSDSCVLCHQKDDVHSGTLPNCKECHNQHFWESTSFRHSMTSFPLRGSHRALDCFSCHQSGTYQGTSNSCIYCHSVKRNDVDNTNFAHGLVSTQECSDCHNQFTFEKK